MPLIKVYNNDSDPYGLKGHSIFKSVRPFIFGYAIIPKLHEWCLRRHVRAASAEAISFCRTFGDEAWSQHFPCCYKCICCQIIFCYLCIREVSLFKSCLAPLFLTCFFLSRRSLLGGVFLRL
jgi:hypothetical protein